MATPLPSSEDLERVQAFTREPFVLEGEDVAAALAAGSPRRAAYDAALAEVRAGAKQPSEQWRRDWSLLLGLERVLGVEEPTLADGTTLNAHQVDALSGTLTALLTERQRSNGNGNGAIVIDEELPLAPEAAAMDAALAEAASALDDDDDEEDDDEDVVDLEADEPDEPQDWAEPPSEDDEDQLPEQPEDPNAGRRFWFEHATGAGKTVAAMGFVEASRTGGVLILTHRRNLVDQFHGELRDRGYAHRIAPPMVRGEDRADGPVTVETYQWFVRNAGNVSGAYTIVICDEAHTALGEKTSAAIRNWKEPIFVGMTATGALIARHVTDLFPTQTSRFDLAQAARRGVIAPLRCVRIPPGPGVRTIAKVPLRKGEVDMEFDQEMLAELLDQLPFNLAIADLYKTRFNGVPGVVYAAGVRHAMNVAEAFRELGMKAQGVSGETPKRELAEILAAYEAGDVDVLVNAQLLAEGWNSPRATVCMHLAPTASKRIYQQRVGRVTRRHPGKEAGIVVDFVHPGTKHDDPVVTLHSLLDRDVYRGGAIVVGPVRRGRGRRLRVERRVLPVCSDENRRIEVFERELWRIAVEHLDYGEQIQWAALAGARVAANGWRRARAMLHFDTSGELKRTFLLTALQRNKNPQLRQRALQEIAASKDDEAFDEAVEVVGTWPRDDRREGVKVLLLALAERKLGRRDQANNWIWRCAEYTRELHEEYAVQRWPETKRLLGLLVNSSGGAHARNARRLVAAARNQDRRLSAALLAAAIPHTAEAGEVLNGARMRMSRKPGALARELLRNFPKGKGRRSRRKKKGRGGVGEGQVEAGAVGEDALVTTGDGATETPKRSRRSRRRRNADPGDTAVTAPEAAVAGEAAPDQEAPKPRRSRSRKPAEAEAEVAAADQEAPKPRRTRATKSPDAGTEEAPKSRRTRATKSEDPGSEEAPTPRRTRATRAADAGAEDAPTPRRTRTTRAADAGAEDAPTPRRSRSTKADSGAEEAPKPRRSRATTSADAGAEDAPKPRRTRATKAPDAGAEEAPKPRGTRATKSADDGDAPKPRRTRAKAAADAPGDEPPKPGASGTNKAAAAKRSADVPEAA